LDYENVGQQALDTNLNIFVESVNNLGTPPSAKLETMGGKVNAWYQSIIRGMLRELRK
jgi:hypothetical protein